MRKGSMGYGAAMGAQHTKASRAFSWLWHSWMEAQSELPILRWLALAAVANAGLAAYLAVAEGNTVLDAVVYGMIALLFVMAFPVIYYLLFEVYRKHRSDAIFDSRRLTDLIRKIAREELEADAEEKMALENTLLMMRPGEAPKNGSKKGA